MEQGANALEDTASQAAKVGAVIDTETINKAADFSSRWERSSVEWAAKMKAAALSILPYLDDLIDKATEFAKSLPDRAKSDAEKIFDTMDKAGIPKDGTFTIEFTPEAKKFWDDTQSLFSSWIAKIDNLRDKAGVASSFGERFGAATSEPGPPLDVTGGAGRAFSSIVSIKREDLPPAGIDWEKETKGLLGYNDALERYVKDLELAAQGHSRVAGTGNDVNDSVDRAINTVRRHTEQMIADAKAAGLAAGTLAALRAQAAPPSNDNSAPAKKSEAA